DFWFVEGTDVVFHAEAARGFVFDAWGGALAGLPNPALYRVAAPADVTAVFRTGFTTQAEATRQAEAARRLVLTLEAVNGNEPYTWFLDAGRLPDGLVFDAGGTIEGAALETGTFPLDLRVRDAYGLSASGRLVLEIAPPAIGVDALTGPF